MCLLSILLMDVAERLALSGLAAGHLLALSATGALLALGVASLLPLELLLVRDGGHHVAVVVFRLELLYGSHRRGAVALPQSVGHLGQLLDVGQLRTGQVGLYGHRQPHGEGTPE